MNEERLRYLFVISVERQVAQSSDIVKLVKVFAAQRKRKAKI